MTTAHKPTYNPAKGGNLQGGNKLYQPSKQFSSKDLPGNMTLKKRQIGHGGVRELRNKDFKKELLEREARAKQKKNAGKDHLEMISSIYADSNDFTNLDDSLESSKVDFTSDLADFEKHALKKPRLDSSVSEIAENKSGQTENVNNVFIQDKDIEFDEDADANSLADLSQDEDSEEELFRELEKIKQQREEEKRLKEMEEAEKMQKDNQEDVLKANPLLNSTGYSLKKKWFEDTVFKNQAKTEPKVKKRFINDSVRSDFHRKFLAKTIQ